MSINVPIYYLILMYCFNYFYAIIQSTVVVLNLLLLLINNQYHELSLLIIYKFMNYVRYYTCSYIVYYFLNLKI